MGEKEQENYFLQLEMDEDDGITLENLKLRGVKNYTVVKKYPDMISGTADLIIEMTVKMPKS